jgi:hypothetical protein
VPDTKSIEIRNDSIVIRGEFDATERTIYLDGRAASAPTVHGHSLGHWEGGTLVVETDAFADHPLGIAYGVPSGAAKRVVERLTLNDDGTALTYAFEMTDPEFLVNPLAGETTWAYRPDLAFAESECSLDNARQYLED